MSLTERHLLEITKGSAAKLNQMRLGTVVASKSGKTIDDLLIEASRDRFYLAFGFLKCARQMAESTPLHHRTMLARAYYAIYHAARSVVFLDARGDDHEEHQTLPKNLPKDFADRARWENEIKTARLERNRADYDPYPRGDRAFSDSAAKTLAIAEEFIPIARAYLKKKGCKL